jgi:hypothetical protein
MAPENHATHRQSKKPINKNICKRKEISHKVTRAARLGIFAAIRKAGKIASM